MAEATSEAISQGSLPNVAALPNLNRMGECHRELSHRYKDFSVLHKDISTELVKIQNLPSLSDSAAILRAIEGLNGRFDRIEQRLDRLEQRFELLDGKMDGVESRLGLRIQAPLVEYLSEGWAAPGLSGFAKT
jgi:hypothetical protein